MTSKQRKITEQKGGSPEYLGILIPESDPTETVQTFGDLFWLYMRHQKWRIKESSYYTTLSRAKHILPYFEKRNLSDIAIDDVERWLSTKSAYSDSYRRKLLSIITASYRFGFRHYNIPDITLKLEPLKKRKKKKRPIVWTKEEYHRYISVIDDEIYLQFFRFLYISGCRKGEAQALTFHDLNKEKGTVRINKTLTKKTFQGNYAITSPKTESSDRIIEVPKELIQDLFNLQKSEDDIFVFGGDKPLSASTIDRRHQKFCNLSGVTKITIHGFRHSSASYLVSGGIPISAISERLGHANVTETYNTYSHAMPTDIKKILDAFKLA